MKDKDPRLSVFRRTLYQETFRPMLLAGPIDLIEARKILDEFNQQNGTDLNAFDIFMCTVRIENDHLTPTEPISMCISAAQLAVKDCNVDLLDSKKRDEHEVLRSIKSIAEGTAKAWAKE